MPFQNILGHTLAHTILKNGLKNDSLSQSLLFHGPDSCGKMTTAYALAKVLNCQNNVYDYCNQCDSCKKINRFLHPDITVINTDNVLTKIKLLFHQYYLKPNLKLFDALIFYLNDLYYRFTSHFFSFKGNIKNNKKNQNNLKEKIIEHKIVLSSLREHLIENELDSISTSLDPKTGKNLNKIFETAKTIYESLTLNNISVETIRTVIKKLYLKPVEGKSKVFIINGIEWMRQEGANTFLKGIEEPPPQNKLVLITENLDVILPTIRSRCFVIPFRNLTHQDHQSILEEQFGIMLSDKKSKDSFKRSGLWDYFSDKNTTVDFVEEFFHTVIKKYKKGDDLFRFVDNVLENNELKPFFYMIFDFFRDAKKIKYGMMVERKNIFQLLPDKTIDQLVRDGEELFPRIEQFNLNRSLALTSYLMKIAQYFHLFK